MKTRLKQNIRDFAEKLRRITANSDFILKKITQAVIIIAYLFIIYAILDEFIRSINLFSLEFKCSDLSIKSCKKQMVGNITCIIFIFPWIYHLIKNWNKNINWLFVFIHIFYFFFNVIVLTDIDDATMLIIPELKSIVCYHGVY